MRIAAITDIPLLCTETMYLDELRKGMKELGVAVNLFSVSSSQSTIEGKLPLQRLFHAVSLLGRLSRYNLLHVQFSFPLGFLYAISKRVHRKPLLVHTHGVDVFSVPSVNYGLRRNFLGRLFARKTWATAPRIITVCERARKELQTAGISPQKIHVLYNGVDVDHFRRQKVVEEQLVKIRESSDLIFLNVASLSPVKNHKTLLRAFSQFVKNFEVGHNARLVLCGQGSQKRQIQAMAYDLKIHDKVVLLGFQPHHKMPEMYSFADIFVLPSLSEAHPWSLLEAMSCGLPSIASDVGGISETIQDKRVLFDSRSQNSVDGLASRMVFLAEDGKRRRKIGAQNRETILRRFTIQHHLENLYRIYDEMLS